MEGPQALLQQVSSASLQVHGQMSHRGSYSIPYAPQVGGASCAPSPGLVAGH